MYEQMNHASIINTSLRMGYQPVLDWTFSASASYRYGQGSSQTILPLIQPFSYKVGARYEKNEFFAEVSLEGNSKNRNSTEFGETQKSAFVIVNVALSNDFEIGNYNITAKLSVENLFDRYYSSFDDWFGIPKMGRNIYVNLIFRF